MSLKRNQHFDRVAKTYRAASASFPWFYIRRSEVRAVMHALGQIQNEEILEYGCGSGYYTELLLSKKVRHVTAIDASSAMIDNIPDHERLTKLAVPAHLLDISRQFNTILSCGMLEFVDDIPAVLDNFTKHAQQSASLVLLVPSQSIPGYFYRLYHMVNSKRIIPLFRRQQIKVLLNNAGWDILEVQKAGLFSLVIRARRKQI